MSRPAFVTGLVLLAIGLAVLAWKTLLLGLPVVPSGPEDLWRVELAIDARGSGARGSVRVALPQSEPGQTVFDEHLVSGRLLFTIRTPDEQRTGIWSGAIDGVHRLAHAFRVQLAPLPERPLDPAAQPPQAIRDEFGRAGRELPSESAPIREALGTVIGPTLEDPAARVRTLFAFVADEVATAPGASNDALLVLAAREGSELGKARLLVTLLRAAGVPARVAAGLHLAAGKDARPATWAEAWVGGDWLPLSPTEGFVGTRPADLLVLRRGEGPLVEATGVEAIGYRWHVVREQLRREELAVLTVPPNAVLARLSLYRLPLATQDVLRVLLLIPLGALVVSLFRNLVGINTFGTFMPILLALAMRGTGLVRGLAMIGSVILVGIGGRLLLDRLQLLMVPRLCVLLCLVVLTICGMSLLGYGFESLELYAGVLFPIVILTMLIERFSVTIAEEGLREALIRLGNSTLVALCAYPLFQSAFTEHLMFGFPEIVIAVTGLLVMIGGYTGYRVTELRRFRSLAALVRGPTA